MGWLQKTNGLVRPPGYQAAQDWFRRTLTLEGQERATAIAMYFDPATKAPITLLELGLFARSGKVIVCCPPGFWRRGNVEIVCARYRVDLVENLSELV